MGGSPDVPDSTTTTTKPPKYLEPYLKDASARAKGLSDVPMPYFPGQTYLSPNAFQDQAAAEALAYGTSPGMMTQINNAMGAQQFMLAAPDVANNPYVSGLKDMNERRTMEAVDRYSMPAIQDQAVGAGGLGGSRQGIAEGLARGEAYKSIGDYNAQVDAAAYESGLTQQRSGMAYVPQTMGLGYQPSQALGAFGDYAQQEPMAALGEQMDRYNYEQMEPWDRLKMAMSIYQGIPGGVTTGTNPNAGMGTNPYLAGAGLGLQAYSAFGNPFAAAGGAGSVALGASSIPAGFGALTAAGGMGAEAAMTAALMASDRRMKTDITPIGKVGRHEWYAFRYKDEVYGKGLQIGVMADEVEKIAPEAVVTMDNGYKAVNYGML